MPRRSYTYAKIDQCTICLKTYKFPSGLWTHLQKVHKITDHNIIRAHMRMIDNPEFVHESGSHYRY